MNLINFLNPRYILYAIVAAAIGFSVYSLHYKPMRALTNQKVICCKINQTQKDLIQVQENRILNLETELRKARDDIETEKANTELCEYEHEIYKEDNVTIKDTSDENYLNF